MKLIKTIVLGNVLAVSAVGLFAAPPAKRTMPNAALRSQEQFAELKEGEKVALVCKQCDSVTVETIQSREQALKYCEEGAEVHCPSCKTRFKVVKAAPSGPSGKKASAAETKIVNRDGMECMFVTKLTE